MWTTYYMNSLLFAQNKWNFNLREEKNGYPLSRVYDKLDWILAVE